MTLKEILQPNSKRKKLVIEMPILFFLVVFLLPQAESGFQNRQLHQREGNEYSNFEVLDNGRYVIQWSVDREQRQIMFETTVMTRGYVGFGLSSKGRMLGADIVLGGVYSNGTTYFTDRHGRGNQEPVVDKSQDWQLHEAEENSTHTTLRFSRALDTCDRDDYQINEHDTVVIIWSYGRSDNPSQYHVGSRGQLAVNLLDPNVIPREIKQASFNPEPPSRVLLSKNKLKMWTITAKQRVSKRATSRHCTVHQAPRLKRKHHIVGFRTRLETQQALQHTHNLQLYRCSAPPMSDPEQVWSPFVNGTGADCTFMNRPTGEIPTQYCTEITYVYGTGGRIMFYPDHIGQAMGELPEEFYLLQVNFDNPDRRNDIKVEVNIDVYYTDQLRPSELGILSIGHQTPGSPSLLIPPASPNHEIFGHCGSDCTERMLPREGINIFQVAFRAKRAARKLRLRHVRRPEELPWIMEDNNYDVTYQGYRVLNQEVNIQRGDHLFLQCTYDSTKSNGTVTGGISFRHEVCLAYIYFYNRLPEEYAQCRSEITDDYYQRRYLGVTNSSWSDDRNDVVAVLPPRLASKTLVRVSNTEVKWTREMKRELQEDQRSLPQVSVCPRSDALSIAAQGQEGTEEESTFPVKYPTDSRQYVPPQRLCSKNREKELGAVRNQFVTGESEEEAKNNKKDLEPVEIAERVRENQRRTKKNKNKNVPGRGVVLEEYPNMDDSTTSGPPTLSPVFSLGQTITPSPPDMSDETEMNNLGVTQARPMGPVMMDELIISNTVRPPQYGTNWGRPSATTTGSTTRSGNRIRVVTTQSNNYDYDQGYPVQVINKGQRQPGSGERGNRLNVPQMVTINPAGRNNGNRLTLNPNNDKPKKGKGKNRLNVNVPEQELLNDQRSSGKGNNNRLNPTTPQMEIVDNSAQRQRPSGRGNKNNNPPPKVIINKDEIYNGIIPMNMGPISENMDAFNRLTGTPLSVMTAGPTPGARSTYNRFDGAQMYLANDGLMPAAPAGRNTFTRVGGSKPKSRSRNEKPRRIPTGPAPSTRGSTTPPSIGTTLTSSEEQYRTQPGPLIINEYVPPVQQAGRNNLNSLSRPSPYSSDNSSTTTTSTKSQSQGGRNTANRPNRPSPISNNVPVNPIRPTLLQPERTSSEERLTRPSPYNDNAPPASITVTQGGRVNQERLNRPNIVSGIAPPTTLNTLQPQGGRPNSERLNRLNPFSDNAPPTILQQGGRTNSERLNRPNPVSDIAPPTTMTVPQDQRRRPNSEQVNRQNPFSDNAPPVSTISQQGERTSSERLTRPNPYNDNVLPSPVAAPQGGRVTQERLNRPNIVSGIAPPTTLTIPQPQGGRLNSQRVNRPMDLVSDITPPTTMTIQEPQGERPQLIRPNPFSDNAPLPPAPVRQGGRVTQERMNRPINLGPINAPPAMMTIPQPQGGRPNSERLNRPSPFSDNAPATISQPGGRINSDRLNRPNLVSDNVTPPTTIFTQTGRAPASERLNRPSPYNLPPGPILTTSTTAGPARNTQPRLNRPNIFSGNDNVVPTTTTSTSMGNSFFRESVSLPQPTPLNQIPTETPRVVNTFPRDSSEEAGLNNLNYPRRNRTQAIVYTESSEEAGIRPRPRKPTTPSTSSRAPGAFNIGTGTGNRPDRNQGQPGQRNTLNQVVSLQQPYAPTPPPDASEERGNNRGVTQARPAGPIAGVRETTPISDNRNRSSTTSSPSSGTTGPRYLPKPTSTTPPPPVITTDPNVYGRAVGNDDRIRITMNVVFDNHDGTLTPGGSKELSINNVNLGQSQDQGHKENQDRNKGKTNPNIPTVEPEREQQAPEPQQPEPEQGKAKIQPGGVFSFTIVGNKVKVGKTRSRKPNKYPVLDLGEITRQVTPSGYDTNSQVNNLNQDSIERLRPFGGGAQGIEQPATQNDDQNAVTPTPYTTIPQGEGVVTVSTLGNLNSGKGRNHGSGIGVNVANHVTFQGVTPSPYIPNGGVVTVSSLGNVNAAVGDLGNVHHSGINVANHVSFERDYGRLPPIVVNPPSIPGGVATAQLDDSGQYLVPVPQYHNYVGTNLGHSVHIVGGDIGGIGGKHTHSHTSHVVNYGDAITNQLENFDLGQHIGNLDVETAKLANQGWSSSGGVVDNGHGGQSHVIIENDLDSYNDPHHYVVRPADPGQSSGSHSRPASSSSASNQGNGDDSVSYNDWEQGEAKEEEEEDANANNDDNTSNNNNNSDNGNTSKDEYYSEDSGKDGDGESGWGWKSE